MVSWQIFLMKRWCRNNFDEKILAFSSVRGIKMKNSKGTHDDDKSPSTIWPLRLTVRLDLCQSTRLQRANLMDYFHYKLISKWTCVPLSAAFTQTASPAQYAFAPGELNECLWRDNKKYASHWAFQGGEKAINELQKKRTVERGPSVKISATLCHP